MASAALEPPPAGSQPDLEVQQLEQLADQIQAEAAEAEQRAEEGATAAAAAPAEQQPPAAQPSGPPPAASRATAPAYDGGQLVHQCWEEAVDLNSGHPYWFNRATVRPDWRAAVCYMPRCRAAGCWPSVFWTWHNQGTTSFSTMLCLLQGVSQWHPPAGWAAAAATSAPAPAAGEAGAAQPPTAQQQEQAPPAAAAYAPGYYYRDVASLMQGPFTLEQLRGWRGSLPMDLPVLQLTQEPQPDAQAPSSEAAPAAGQGGSQGQGQQSGSRWVQMELARLLGDDELLGRWRLEHPEQVCGMQACSCCSGCGAEHCIVVVPEEPAAAQRPPTCGPGQRCCRPTSLSPLLVPPCLAGGLAWQRPARGMVRAGAPARHSPLPGRCSTLWPAGPRCNSGGGTRGGRLRQDPA